MIIRAQSQRALQAQRASTASPAKQKQPCTAASHRVSNSMARHGSLPDLQRLHATATDAEKAHREIASPQDPEVPRREDCTSALTATGIGTIFALLLMTGPAYAAYDRTAGDQLFKNLAGGAYVLLVCFFFYRLFRKRAVSGTTQSLRGQFQESIQDEMKAKESASMEDKPVTALGALWGAVQAGGICFLLFQVCGLVDGYFSGQDMPDQYTARNITVTLRTIVRGLAYLMTFLFGVNCVGLSGLAVQLLFFPEKPTDSKPEDKAQS